MSAFSVEATLKLRDQTAPGIRAFAAIDSGSLRSRARAMGTCNAQSLTPLIAAAIAQASSERIAA